MNINFYLFFSNFRFLVVLIFLLLLATCQHQPSTANLDKLTLLPSINMHLEGKLHPVTQIPFERVVTQRKPKGKLYAIVVPKFTPLYETVLPKKLFLACDQQQFAYLNRELKETISQNPELGKRFSSEQLTQIMAGKRPKGLTWHHDAPLGKMQLVDQDIHQKTAHTGGRWLWGGGSDARNGCSGH